MHADALLTCMLTMHGNSSGIGGRGGDQEGVGRGRGHGLTKRRVPSRHETVQRKNELIETIIGEGGGGGGRGGHGECAKGEKT